MAKRQKRSKIDPNQQSFLHLLDDVAEKDIKIEPPVPIPDTTPGKFDYRLRANLRLTKALKASPLSREEVAEALSALTGEKITVTTINKWTSTTQPHEIPGYMYEPLCLVIGNSHILDETVEATGRKIVDGNVAQAAQYFLLMRYADQKVQHYIQATPLFQQRGQP